MIELMSFGSLPFGSTIPFNRELVLYMSISSPCPAVFCSDCAVRWLFRVVSAGNTWLQNMSKWALESEGRAVVALWREPLGIYVGDSSLPLWNSSRNIKMSQLTDQYDRRDTDGSSYECETWEQLKSMGRYFLLWYIWNQCGRQCVWGMTQTLVTTMNKYFKHISKNYTMTHITEDNSISPIMFFILCLISKFNSPMSTVSWHANFAVTLFSSPTSSLLFLLLHFWTPWPLSFHST